MSESPLVEKLRWRAKRTDSTRPMRMDLEQAASEIERLETALRDSGAAFDLGFSFGVAYERGDSDLDCAAARASLTAATIDREQEANK